MGRDREPVFRRAPAVGDDGFICMVEDVVLHDSIMSTTSSVCSNVGSVRHTSPSSVCRRLHLVTSARRRPLPVAAVKPNSEAACRSDSVSSDHGMEKMFREGCA